MLIAMQPPVSVDGWAECFSEYGEQFPEKRAEIGLATKGESTVKVVNKGCRSDTIC